VGVTAIAVGAAPSSHRPIGFLWCWHSNSFAAPIPDGRAEAVPIAAADRVRWVELLRYRRLAIFFCRFFADPYGSSLSSGSRIPHPRGGLTWPALPRGLDSLPRRRPLNFSGGYLTFASSAPAGAESHP